VSGSEKHAGSGEGIRANILFGLAISTLLIGGVGAWAATTSLAGAVIATGNVVVESKSKKVQHQTGGIVGEILVKEGDRVSAGDIIVRLDETMTRANLQIIAQQYDRTVARQARLQAERLGLANIKFPEELVQRASDPDVETVLAGETALIESRTKASTGLKSQLEARSGQLKSRSRG
jgi:HlyD family secretion protein